MSHVLSEAEVLSVFERIGTGKKVIIKFCHPRDRDTVRVCRGELHRRPTGWIVRRSASSYNVVPSKDSLVISIDELEGAPSRSTSQRRDDEAEAMVTAEPLGSGCDPEDRTPAQPAAPLHGTIDLQMQLLKMMQDQMQQHKEEMNALKQLVASQRRPSDDVPDRRQASEVTTMFQIGEAIRGKDNPTVRLAHGLLIPRFLQPRFAIFSMPHLVYQFDPISGEKIKMTKGTAVAAYLTMLSSCKLQFPGQVAVAAGKRPRDTKHDEKTPTDNDEAIRLQIEIAERVFVGLLSQLDQMNIDEMPSSRDEWMIFLDAGASLLALYATLAYGFVRGGARVTMAYNEAIHSGGTFNTAKLWSASSEFRKH